MSRHLRAAWIVAGAIVSIPIIGFALFHALSLRPPSYTPSAAASTVPVALRSWPEHDAIYTAANFPYVLALDGAGSNLRYIGVRHTSDAADPQLTELERRWVEFRPTVAPCEGRTRMFHFMSRPASGTLHESELTMILARRAGVPLYTLEPRYEEEVSALLERFDPPLVAAFFTLRVFTSEFKESGGNPDALALHLLRKRTDVDGLRGSLNSIAQLDAVWKDRIASDRDWRTLTTIEGIPLLDEIGDVSREARGRHMVRSIVDLARRGERVLAVVGASHVIRQEPALRAALTPQSRAP